MRKQFLIVSDRFDGTNIIISTKASSLMLSNHIMRLRRNKISCKEVRRGSKKMGLKINETKAKFMSWTNQEFRQGTIYEF